MYSPRWTEWGLPVVFRWYALPTQNYLSTDKFNFLLLRPATPGELPVDEFSGARVFYKVFWTNIILYSSNHQHQHQGRSPRGLALGEIMCNQTRKWAIYRWRRKWTIPCGPAGSSAAKCMAGFGTWWEWWVWGGDAMQAIDFVNSRRCTVAIQTRGLLHTIHTMIDRPPCDLYLLSGPGRTLL